MLIRYWISDVYMIGEVLIFNMIFDNRNIDAALGTLGGSGKVPLKLLVNTGRGSAGVDHSEVPRLSLRSTGST